MGTYPVIVEIATSEYKRQNTTNFFYAFYSLVHFNLIK